jgi:cytidylate kinase
LGYRHIDSGAMYRAVAWKALHTGVALDDDASVAALAGHSRIEIASEVILIDGEDVTRAIRTPEIDRAAAAVARLPKVRQTLVALQRELGADGGIVMEGRDIGTVVFPQADVKIYLDASAEERARRRALDPAHGRAASIDEVALALNERDRSDRTRDVSPLYVASDAVLVDTTGRPVLAVVAEVMDVVQSRLTATA